MKTIPKKYQANVEMIVSVARGFLSEGQVLQAMAFLGKFNEGVVPLPINMSDKDRSAIIIREICKVAKPDYIIMLSEAWMVERKDTSSARKVFDEGNIANLPDRMEVIMLSLETREGLWFGKSQIKLLDDGKRGFDDLQFDMTKELEGRFTCFLPREGSTH